ncbi:MAG TPA: MiaB/RimO family radical SAM methylthiotransferase [Patescibacteria group bacterium]|nr:MiaB/RimO family radical SAM methylthiotransferase [Patescibacteria group bacterium]
MKTFFIKTFGCQQNKADSERIAGAYLSRGFTPADRIEDANHVVINTCMIRESAENRVYGMVYNLGKKKHKKSGMKIILTGCMVGIAARDHSGKYLSLLKKKMPSVDEFLPIEEVGFDTEPLRTSVSHAWVPISNGCNNFCTFCIVPFTRGREISRPFEEILSEVKMLSQKGYKEVTLLGQNVNSYGADLVMGIENIQVLRDIQVTYFEPKLAKEGYKLPDGKVVHPVYVRHLGRQRIPTLFPFLLETVGKISGIQKVDFLSSNPWDFSDELIETIAKSPVITRHLHLPVQSGDDTVLKRMNRWYSSKEYLDLIGKIRKKIPGVTFGTDIIVGFPGETKEQFLHTVRLCKKVGFSVAYISMYSQRPGTAAVKAYKDDVPHKEKRRRWKVLEELINTPHLKKKRKKE